MFGHSGPVQFDVFAHLWDYNTVGSDLVQVSEDELEELRDLLKPKAMLVQGAIDARTQMIANAQRDGIDEPSAVLWQASQFYSVMRSAHLKRAYEVEHGFEYDVCVRARTDLAFTREPPSRLARFPVPDPDTLYTVHSYFDDEHARRRTGDLFFYGDSSTFDRACDFFRFAHRHTVSAYTLEGRLAPPETAFHDYVTGAQRLTERQVDAEPQLRRPPEYAAVLARENRALGRHETF